MGNMKRKQATSKPVHMNTLEHYGINDPKIWLLKNVGESFYTTNYNGNKPVIVNYQGQEFHFTTYAEAGVYFYEKLNCKEEKKAEGNSYIKTKINRLEKLLNDETVSENEKEEIKAKIKELKASL